MVGVCKIKKRIKKYSHKRFNFQDIENLQYFFIYAQNQNDSNHWLDFSNRENFIYLLTFELLVHLIYIIWMLHKLV